MNQPKNQNQPARRQQQQPAQERHDQGPPPLVIFRDDLKENMALFKDLLGAGDTEVKRFQAGAFQAIRRNPKLLDAHRGSLLMALAETAALRLSTNPSLGESWLVPRWDKHAEMEVVSQQTGAYGYVKLVNRGVPIDNMRIDVVRRGDKWSNFGGTNHRLEHEIPLEGVDESDEGILAAYACIQLRGSERPYERVMSRAKLIQSAERSGSNKNKDWSKFWKDHFEPMCLVAVTRKLAKRIPGADDAADAIYREDARARGERVYHDRVTEAMGGMEPQPTKKPKALDVMVKQAQDGDRADG